MVHYMENKNLFYCILSLLSFAFFLIFYTTIMKGCKKYLLVFLFLVLGITGEIPACLAQKDKPFGFNPIRKKQNYTFCPFELRANLIVVKTVVDNSDTLNFILDSGVQSIIILDTTLRKKLNLKIAREISISGIGEAPPVTASISLGHTVKFGGIAGYGQNIVVLEENFLNLSEYLGMPVHGILGSDVFKRFSVEIDYNTRQLTFSDPYKYRYKKHKGVAIPLHLERTKPYITVNRLESNGEKIENLKLVIDTGGAHSLLLNQESLPPAIIPHRLSNGYLGRGLNGNIEGKLGRIDLLRFANHDFKNVIASFPDSLVFDSKFTKEHELRHGSIGGEILKRFVVTLNYSQNLMVLKPIKKTLKKPFESDMSGLDLRATGKDFKTFEVSAVIPNSVAHQAGVLPGDKVIIFNNKLANFMTINELYEQLCKKEGHLIEMVVLRDHRLIQVSFRLRRSI